MAGGFDRDLSALRRLPRGEALPQLLLVLLSLPLLLYGLGSYSVVNGDEAIYHAVAERMVESGNWLRLEFKGEHRLYDTWMNAPIQYWARATLIAIFGSSLWTMRVLSALLGVATVLLTHRLVVLVADRRAALLAGLIQLTTLQFVFLHSARTGELETAISFFFTLSALLFIRGLERGGRWWGHHLCLVALANLKLPVVIIPLAAELACFALDRRSRAFFGGWVRTGLVLLPIGLAWHLSQLAWSWDEFREVARQMLGSATGARFGSGSAGLTDRAHYYAKTLLFGAFPHSLVYPFALIGVLRSARAEAERARWRVLGLYLAALLLFYLCVFLHFPWYIVPAYPLLSAFLGAWLSRLLDDRPGWLGIAAAAVALSLGAWLAAGGPAYNPFSQVAVHIEMATRWRQASLLPGLDPRLGAALGAAGIAALLLLTGSLRGGRTRRLPALLLVLFLLGYGGLRVSWPLAHLDYQSRLAEIRRELDRRLAAGKGIATPVFLPKADRYMVRYYFGDDFDTFPVGEASGYSRTFRGKVGYELYEKGALDSLEELQMLRRERREQERRVEREPLLFP